MDQNRDQCKKCYCARCFFPIDEEDKVDIEGQSFHKGCCMCCVCRKIPISIKMFYGHVFCADCFKEHVMARFRGEGPRMHSNSWWMQWGPQMGPQMRRDCECGGMKPEDCTPEDPSKRTCFCSRCLQPVDETKVTIGDQCFHPQCAKCFFCQRVPTTTPKIYYGQLFCEDCFNRHVLSRNKDNPSEFFRNCFEQWNSPQFAYQMKQFMSTGKSASPMVFMMGQPPVCRCGCGGGPQSVWFPPTEAKRSASLVSASAEGTWESDAFDRTVTSETQDRDDESANLNPAMAAAEKIEKLTKYLNSPGVNSEKCKKKWKSFIEFDKVSIESRVSPLGWVDIQNPKIKSKECPKCLWQCGPIYVNSEYAQKEICCGDSHAI